MRRRAVLGALAAGLAPFAGCATTASRVAGTATPAASRTASTTATPAASRTASTTATPATLARQGFPPTICSEDVVETDIRAIDDPAFAADWAGVDLPATYGDGLAPGDAVIGVAGDGWARAYPVRLLWHHEIVNETLPDGTPLLVTYCSLCRSGMVARRVVDGDPTRFGVSGLLWRPPTFQSRASRAGDRAFGVAPGDPSVEVRSAGNLVLYDAATGSYWSQLLARAICGPERGTGLPVVAARTATWDTWHREHPGTAVLLPPPHSTAANPPYPAGGTDG